MDVYNPFVWAHRRGESNQQEDVRAVNQVDFDSLGCRFINHWWHVGDESNKIVESVRCYSPVDFLLLLEGTRLTLKHAEVAGKPLDMNHTASDELLKDADSYLVQLDHHYSAEN